MEVVVQIDRELLLVRPRTRENEAPYRLQANHLLAGYLGDSQKKRKATGPQQPVQSASEQRLRSPPAFVQSTLSNPPPNRKSHKRQKSDVSWYRSPGHGHIEEGEYRHRATTPSHGPSTGSSRDRDRDRDREGIETRTHSVSSLLSGEPSEHQQASQWPPGPPGSLHGSGLSTVHYRESPTDQQHKQTILSEAEARPRGGAITPGEGTK